MDGNHLAMNDWKWKEAGPLKTNELQPECHWTRKLLNEVAHSATKGSPIPVYLTFGKAVAQSILKCYEDPASQFAVEHHHILSQIRLSADTLARLRHFISATEHSFHSAVIVIPETKLDQLCEFVDSREDLELTDIGIPLRQDLYASAPCKTVSPPPISTMHKTDIDAIVAVIDFGIGFANERFRANSTSTRFEHFWAMNLPPCENLSDVHVGTTWTRSQIDAQMKALDPDERIYNRLRANTLAIDYHQPLARRHSHGTHVLDIATGYGPNQLNKASRHPIIGVQLPVEIVEDTSGAGATPWLALALEWITARSLDIATTHGLTQLPPLVLNFSFGTNAGPMDGKSNVETVLTEFRENYDRMAGPGKCQVVLPAGNSYLERGHFRKQISESIEIPWRIVPDDKTASFVQIWLPPTPKSKPGNVAVSLLPPNIEKCSVQSKPGHSTDLCYRNRVIGKIYHQLVSRENDQVRELITVALRPSGSISGEGPLAPAGLWKIRIENGNYNENSYVVARIQRDGAPMSFRRRGIQSYFDHPDYQKYDLNTGRTIEADSETSPVMRSHTLSSYATSSDVWVVGGFRESDGNPAHYTSSGPTESDRSGPDLSAVCERSSARRGVLAAGTFTGSASAFGGTSVAAPAVARSLIDNAHRLPQLDATSQSKQAIKNLITNDTGAVQSSSGPYSIIDEKLSLQLGSVRLQSQSSFAKTSEQDVKEVEFS